MISVLASSAPVALGQTALSLHDAIEFAKQSNRLISAEQERIHSAQGAKLQAGLKPNPRLYYQGENMRVWQQPGLVYWRDVDNFAYFGQSIETGGKRERRIDVAEAAVQRTAAEAELLTRQIVARVAQSFWTAAGATRAAALLNEETRTLTEIVEYTRNRVNEGAAAGADLLRIELELLRVQSLAKTASQDAERARLQLFRDMGRTDFSPTTFADSLETNHPVLVPELNQVLEARPEVQAARKALLQAESNTRLQRANAKPDPEILFGYKRTAGFDTLIAGLQMNLPLRNRNQGAIVSAEADVRVAQETLKAVQAQIEAELASAQSDYKARQALIQETMPQMLERARESARIASLAYREGGVDVLRLLDAERTRIETQLQYARALTEYQQSVVSLQVAAGELQ